MIDQDSKADPMLTPQASDYAVRLMEKVDALVEEDRATFRANLKKPIENPALLIGGTGFGGGSKAV